MRSEELATYTGRAITTLKQLREMDESAGQPLHSVGFQELLEQIGMIPAGLVWKDHFFTHTKALIRLLVDGIEVMATVTGEDPADLLKRLVDKTTGEPCRRYWKLVQAHGEEAATPSA